MNVRYNITSWLRLILVAGISLTGSVGLAQSQGILEVTRFDFGMISTSGTVSHTFWIRSGPADTIRLRDVKTGCGCVRADRNGDLAQPGDSLGVTLLWNSKSDSDTSQTAYVFFEGSPEPVRLNVVTASPSPNPFLSVSPSSVEFPTAKAARKESAGIRVSNLSGRELGLKVVSVPADKMKVVVPEKLAPGGVVTAQIGLVQPDDTTRFERSITLEAFEAASKKSYRITVPVRQGAVLNAATTMTGQQ